MEKVYKNENIGNFDEYQMANRAFDPTKDAYRFTLVDGLDIKTDNITLPELKLPEQSASIREIYVPQIIVETRVERVEIPVMITEVKLVDRPVIVPEIRIIEIEKPVIIKEIEIKIIEQKVQEMPTIAKVCMVVQALALIGMLIMKVL